MRISEVAKLTGLSVSNIRFYEKKGLLAPVREEESKYRDYSAQDVRQLKEIILYRKMNLPIETIYLLMRGEASLESVLRHQEEELTAQREMLQGAIELCRKMQREPDLEHIDVDAYLNYVYTEEEAGRKFAQVEELLEDWADFMHLSQRMYPLMGNFSAGRLVQNVWVSRGISAALLLACIGLPLGAIWGLCHEDGGAFPTLTAVFFWITWFACLLYAFLRYRRLVRGKRGGDTQEKGKKSQGQ